MLNKITTANLRGDLFGGVTAAIVSLPLALAFGLASGAGVEAGIYGALLVGLFASLFGGTPTLISEPTGPMTVVMAAVITSLIAENPENGMAMAFTVVMLAGCFQILFGLSRLGRFITLMPHSVISGFMSGIGIILIILQFPSLTGNESPAGGVLGTLWEIPALLSKVSIVELSIGLLTLVILIGYPTRWKRYVPPQLVALIALTVLAFFAWDSQDLRRIGEINIGIPSLILPQFSQAELQTILVDALVLGVLGCIDSMLTSLIADNLTRSEHNSDKELIGQGVGNVMSGLFGGLPGAGATMGTVVNIQAGGRTIMSGVIRVLVLAVAVFGISGAIEWIPLAVLSGIAIKVGIDILDWSFIKRAHRVSWQSTFVMYTVILLTVFVDLIAAVAIGVFVANIMIIDKLSRAQSRHIKVLSDFDDQVAMPSVERQMLEQLEGKCLLVYLSGPMIFGVAKVLSRQHETIKDFDSVVIDMTDVSMMDDTISLTIENTISFIHEHGKRAVLVIKQEELREKFDRMGITQKLSKDSLFHNRAEAFTHLLRKIDEESSSPPGVVIG